MDKYQSLCRKRPVDPKPPKRTEQQDWRELPDSDKLLVMAHLDGTLPLAMLSDKARTFIWRYKEQV